SPRRSGESGYDSDVPSCRGNSRSMARSDGARVWNGDGPPGMRPAAHQTIRIATGLEGSDQHPNATVHVPGGRRSHLNAEPGPVKEAALLPATEAGKTINVTAEPATVVPGVAMQSTPTVQPLEALDAVPGP